MEPKYHKTRSFSEYIEDIKKEFESCDKKYIISNLVVFFISITLSVIIPALGLAILARHNYPNGIIITARYQAMNNIRTDNGSSFRFTYLYPNPEIAGKTVEVVGVYCGKTLEVIRDQNGYRTDFAIGPWWVFIGIYSSVLLHLSFIFLIERIPFVRTKVDALRSYKMVSSILSICRLLMFLGIWYYELIERTPSLLAVFYNILK
jgi:hypothetical protein